MQNICVFVSTLIVTIHMKSVRSNIYVNENQSDSDYKSSLRPFSITKETQKSLDNDDENWLGLYKTNDDKIMASVKYDDDSINSLTENTADDRFLNYRTLNDVDSDMAKFLLGTYLNLLRMNTKLSFEDDTDNFGSSKKYDKRALTMLTRWKPFRIPNSIGGNGRHVIRSPLTVRSDSSNSYGKMQVMGRPFRWG